MLWHTDKLYMLIRDKKYKKAKNYISKFGKSFWDSQAIKRGWRSLKCLHHSIVIPFKDKRKYFLAVERGEYYDGFAVYLYDKMDGICQVLIEWRIDYLKSYEQFIPIKFRKHIKMGL